MSRPSEGAVVACQLAALALGGTLVLGGACGVAVAADAATAGREMRIPGPAGPLAGTFVAAGGERPATVLIVPGSGPTDRDGDNPGGVRAAPYRLLAEALAKRGVSSLRIDKRGLFGSASAVADANAVTVSDYVDDVRGWVRALRDVGETDCVVPLGHSEGALVALAAARDAAADGDELCGLVLVGSPGRPLGDIVREQLGANPALAALRERADAVIDELEAGRRVPGEELPPALAPLFRPAVQGFVIELFAIDPPALLAALELPVLILQGERDLQVATEDARRLARAAPSAELVLVPDANHVLKAVPADDRAANIAAYADPALPLADGVVDAVAGFVEGLRRP